MGFAYVSTRFQTYKALHPCIIYAEIPRAVTLVPIYVAKNQVLDRALMEQVKGQGRLQQEQLVPLYATPIINSRGNVGNSFQGVPYVNRLSAIVQRWRDVKDGKDRCYKEPSRHFSEISSRTHSEISVSLTRDLILF